MCSAENAVPFELKTKCCTYIPSIPNFLAGKILEKNVVVFQSYWSRADVNPQGVWPHHEFVAEYNPSSHLFGRNIKWRCPYYLEEEGGLCGIWEDRNGRCATWFCKHLRGRISHDFWSAVERLLTAVERSVSRWCILELEAGSQEFRNAFPPELSEPRFAVWLQQQSFYTSANNDALRESIWGKWLHHEREFFCQCARLVASLQWNEVREICGREIDALEERVLESFARLNSDFFPDVLKLSDFHQTDNNPDEVRVWTVNPYDPVTISKTILRLLHRENGKRMHEVMEHVPKELLVRLFDAGILI